MWEVSDSRSANNASMEIKKYQMLLLSCYYYYNDHLIALFVLSKQAKCKPTPAVIFCNKLGLPQSDIDVEYQPHISQKTNTELHWTSSKISDTTL